MQKNKTLTGIQCLFWINLKSVRNNMDPHKIKRCVCMKDNVKILRCRICGDPYIGTEAPSRCPFCGAGRNYFVDAADWNPSEYEVKLSNKTKANLETTLELEIDNTAFYECSMNEAKAAGEEYYIAKFKALKKVEAEHAAAVCKFLKISTPPLPKTQCSTDMLADTKEGFERETHAIKSYTCLLYTSPSPRD